jgi:hypothetical protein
MLPWVLGITSVIVLFALGFLLYGPRKSRYMETTDWQREQWEHQHEREKILLHREL